MPTTTPVPTIRLPIGLDGADQRTTRPATLVILGTAHTGPWCARALGRAPGDPGCSVVTVGGAPGDAAAIDPHARGLSALHAAIDRPGSLWIVCLPEAMRAERESIALEARRLGIALRAVAPVWEQVGLDAPADAVGVVGAGVAGRASAHGTWTPPVDPTSFDLGALIGRAPRPVDDSGLREMVAGRRVLVTGAGGSIGSELARCCARLGPAEIALVERSEHALFQIDRELRETMADVPRAAILHDVVDAPRTRRLVEGFGPDIVLHAAAHKHVPLMEDHPADAVHNNVFGTVSVADAARYAGASRFVLISSDKAVRPSSVMGATKRIAELYVSALSRGLGTASGPGRGGTAFASVRFGNVLGSSGSVLTIWADQLRTRGRLTVTDPRMTRYFMTIPEAAALVLQAAALARPESRDTLFVLDMGEPVRILDLAERFLSASGATPGAIDITGIRPGEKLHEALAYEDEALRPTAHPAITCLPQRPGADGTGPTTPGELNLMLSDLDGARLASDPGEVIDALARHVPGFRRNRSAA